VATTSGVAEPLPRAFPGGRVRRLRPRDLDAFLAYRSIPELGRYQGWSRMSEDETRAFLVEMCEAPLFPRGEWIQLGIADAATDDLVGDIGVHVAEDGRSAEIGFTLAPSAQGRGIATAAVHATLDAIFASTDCERVHGITDVRNAPSARLLERVGFVLRERRETEFRGEPCTEAVYAIARGYRVP
jgi:RimJ/RimL family protein N-acetyltransferase